MQLDIESKNNLCCEVCGSKGLDPLLDLGRHPLCDDLIAIGSVEKSITYPIEILFCENCKTAHQKFSVPKRILFPTSYHYRSRFTSDVLNGMNALALACEQKIGSLNGKTVLDIGCNDTSLLGFFKKKGAITVGIEPTDAILDGANMGHHLIQDYFDLNTADLILKQHGTPDIITFTNVFAHIEDLPSLIQALKKLIGDNTLLVIENHYLGAVLDRYQFDTFYHEHPRTYSLTSFKFIADGLGGKLEAVEFPSRYGGNIRVFITKNKDQETILSSEIENVLENEKTFGEKLSKFQKLILNWKKLMHEQINTLHAKHGKLHAKAFPGRAAILVKLLELDSDVIQAVYEKPGSMKIGNYLPGTHIPIKSDDELWSMPSPPPVIINLAWHIEKEIKDYLRDNGYQGDIINILSPDDFPRS